MIVENWIFNPFRCGSAFPREHWHLVQLVLQDILTRHTEVHQGALLGPVLHDMVHHGSWDAIRGYLAACLALMGA